MSYPGHSLGGGSYPLCREAVGVFYSPSRLGKRIIWLSFFQVTCLILFRVEWPKVISIVQTNVFFNTPTRHQLYSHLPPITKTIQVRQIKHAGHCWRSRDKLISDVLLRTPTYGWAKAGQTARTYIQQLCEDTACNPEDLPEAMNDREKWQERVRDIRASGTIWWWQRNNHWNACRFIIFFLLMSAYFCHKLVFLCEHAPGIFPKYNVNFVSVSINH